MEQQIDQQHEQHQDFGKSDDQQSEPTGALIERRRRRRPPQGAADLAELGRASGATDEEPPRPVHHRAAHESGVARRGNLRAVGAFLSRLLFGRVRFTGQQGLVDKEITRLDEAPIGRHQVPCGQKHDISGDKFAPRERHLLSVAEHLLLERDLHFEPLGGLFRPIFLDGVERRADQHDRRDDDETRKISCQRGDQARDQQHQHQGVAESAQEFQRQRQPLPLFKHVEAVTGTSRDGFGCGEAMAAGAELPFEIGERTLQKFSPLDDCIGTRTRRRKWRDPLEYHMRERWWTGPKNEQIARERSFASVGPNSAPIQFTAFFAASFYLAAIFVGGQWLGFSL